MFVNDEETLDSLSSTINTLVLAHLVEAFLFILIFFASSSALSIPNPIPAKEWIVTPPILQAAIPVYMRYGHVVVHNIDNIPVDAVTATASEDLICFCLRPAMISRKRTDLPVPRGIESVTRHLLVQRLTSTACIE